MRNRQFGCFSLLFAGWLHPTSCLVGQRLLSDCVSSQNTRHRLGPNSRAERLGRIDGRTVVGKLISRVQSDLASDLGGDPSAAEKILIHAASIKAARLYLLQSQLAAGEAQPDPKHHVAWSNSLRLDLLALGLKRRARGIGLPSGLASFINGSRG